MKNCASSWLFTSNILQYKTRDIVFIILHFLPSHLPSYLYTYLCRCSRTYLDIVQYVWRHTEARSCNHFLSWKSKTYYTFWVCVSSLSHPTCRAHEICCIVVCSLSGSTIFSHIIPQTARFSEISHWTQNVCFDFLYNFCLKHFSFWGELSKIWLKMYINLCVNCPLFLSGFRETWILSPVFRNRLKYKNSMKIRQNYVYLTVHNCDSCRIKDQLDVTCYFYFTSYVLNMFRTLIYPSSGARNYSVELPNWSYFSWFDVCCFTDTTP